MGQDAKIYILTDKHYTVDQLEMKSQAIALFGGLDRDCVELEDVTSQVMQDMRPEEPPVLPGEQCITGIRVGRYFSPYYQAGDMVHISRMMQRCRIEFPEATIWYCGDYDGTAPMIYEGPELGSWALDYINEYKNTHLGGDFEVHGPAPLPSKPSDLTTWNKYRRGCFDIDINVNPKRPVASLLYKGAGEETRIVSEFDADGVLPDGIPGDLVSVIKNKKDRELFFSLSDLATSVMVEVQKTLIQLEGDEDEELG